MKKLIHERGTQETGRGDGSRRRLLLGASLLAGSLMGGCGDVNNYYYGRDGTVQPDAGKHDTASKREGLKHDEPKADARVLKPDKGLPDARKTADAACVPKPAPPTCPNTALPASGILNVSESFPIGSGWRLGLDDVTYAICPPKALMEQQDSCGKAVMKHAFSEGSVNAIQAGGAKLIVSVKKVAAGYTFGAKWVDLSVKSQCPGDTGPAQPPPLPPPNFWCKSVSGQLNQGESLAFGPLKLQLDDLMVLQCAQKQYALPSVLDSNGNTLSKMKIPEGSYEPLALGGVQYRISVPVVGAGGTFNATWANVEVLVGSSKQCK